MNKFRRWIGSLGKLTVLVTLLALFLSSLAVGAPQPVSDEIRGLIGLYEKNGDRLLVREQSGQLELLFATGGEKDQWIQHYALYPMEKIDFHTYRLLASSPLGQRQGTVRFDRDAGGWGVTLIVGNKEYSRQFFGPEKGQVFRIQPLLTADELRALAASAEPPQKQGIFQLPDLVDVRAFDPTIRLDIRYATTDNFMGMALYEQPRALLQRPAAKALAQAHWALEKYGYGIIVYDAYRPWSVTKMFWDATPNNMKMFVADPANGSRHNRGGAVDVGLYDRRTGQIIPMTSGYDEFSLRAIPTYAGGTESERWHRDLLRLVMEGEGFTVYAEEWWHFDYHEWQAYPIMNVPFHEVGK